MKIWTNIIRWSQEFGYRQVPVWYESSKAITNEFQTIGKHLKILKFIPNPFPFYDLIMGFYERESNRDAVEGPVLERSEKIIDVGVGTGYLLSRLIRVTCENQEIIAVDLSEQMLKNSEAYLSKHDQLTSRVKFEKADCMELPWADETFYRIMNELYSLGYYKGRWNSIWRFLFAGYAPHCRPIALGKYLRESPTMVIAYTKVSRVSFFPVRIYYVRKSHD